MCKVISVVNQKGGVGKTTTTVNVGIGLAREGKKVLLIDADPQGSLTASLGYEEPDDLRITLATIMMDVINEEEISLEDGILHHQENVDLLPANIELSALEVTMGNVMSREMIMKEYIDAIRSRYDYILIDCMPSLGMMTINALVSSDSVLIPVQAAYLPVKGLQQLIKTIGRVWVQDRHEDSFRDKRKSFFHRKMLCRDYHNGIHGVLFYLPYCIPISFSGRQISAWEFCFLSVIYYLLFS